MDKLKSARLLGPISPRPRFQELCAFFQHLEKEFLLSRRQLFLWLPAPLQPIDLPVQHSRDFVLVEALCSHRLTQTHPWTRRRRES